MPALIGAVHAPQPDGATSTKDIYTLSDNTAVGGSMTTKELMIGALRSEGYDLTTACEIAARAISGFLASGKQVERLHTNFHSFTLSRAQCAPSATE